MFDAMGKVSESMGQARFLSYELGWPLGVVRQEGDPIQGVTDAPEWLAYLERGAGAEWNG